MSAPKPAHTNPSYVCRRIRQILKAAGYPLHKASGRYSPFGGTKTATEGYDVTKVGCSKSVSVSYSPAYAEGRSSALPKETRRAALADARKLLTDLGYRIDERGWIECDNYDEHDR